MDNFDEQASLIVRANVADWAGNIFKEFTGKDCYSDALGFYFALTDTLDEDETDDIYLNSYDEDGNNHGIFY